MKIQVSLSLLPVCVRRSALFFSDEIQQYTVPFMGSDPSVVKRTQRYLVEEQQATPVSFWFSPLLFFFFVTQQQLQGTVAIK